MKKVAQPKDEDLHAAAWEETKLEYEKGWIWEDTDSSLAQKIIAHRPGLRH